MRKYEKQLNKVSPIITRRMDALPDKLKPFRAALGGAEYNFRLHGPDFADMVRIFTDASDMPQLFLVPTHAQGQEIIEFMCSTARKTPGAYCADVAYMAADDSKLCVIYADPEKLYTFNAPVVGVRSLGDWVIHSSSDRNGEYDAYHRN